MGRTNNPWNEERTAGPDGLDEDGLPIGVQLVGPRWSELRLLGIASELERAKILRGFQAPPIG